MPCALTSAIGLECKDLAGGVKALYFADFQVDGYAGMTFASGVLDGIDTAQTVYRYDVRPETTSFTTTLSNEAAGSAAYNTELSVTLHGITSAMQVELQKLIATRTFCYVLDANDVLFGLGLQNGCTVTGGTMVSGAARSDMRGFTLTVSCAEKEFPPTLTPSADASAATWPFDSIDGGTAVFTVTNPA